MKDTRLSDRNQFVVKSNDLIQKSRYSFNLEAQRIILFAISKIKPQDTVNEWYEFSVSDICHACGIIDNSGANYILIKNYLKELRDKSWYIDMPDGTSTTVSWLDKVKINQGSGTVQVRFDEDLSNYLFDLRRRYTQYKLDTVLCFKSKYSIRLYELMKSYLMRDTLINNAEKDIDFALDDLKKRLDAETYDRYADFKRKVLATAIREINRFSDDMAIAYEEITSGKKVEKILFILTHPHARNIMENRQNKRDTLNKK